MALFVVTAVNSSPVPRVDADPGPGATHPPSDARGGGLKRAPVYSALDAAIVAPIITMRRWIAETPQPIFIPNIRVGYGTGYDTTTDDVNGALAAYQMYSQRTVEIDDSYFGDPAGTVTDTQDGSGNPSTAQSGTTDHDTGVHGGIQVFDDPHYSWNVSLPGTGSPTDWVSWEDWPTNSVQHSHFQVSGAFNWRSAIAGLWGFLSGLDLAPYWGSSPPAAGWWRQNNFNFVAMIQSTVSGGINSQTGTPPSATGGGYDISALTAWRAANSCIPIDGAFYPVAPFDTSNPNLYQSYQPAGGIFSFGDDYEAQAGFGFWVRVTRSQFKVSAPCWIQVAAQFQGQNSISGPQTNFYQAIQTFHAVPGTIYELPGGASFPFSNVAIMSTPLGSYAMNACKSLLLVNRTLEDWLGVGSPYIL